MTTGTTSFPAAQQAAQAAADYLNKTQGGLAGREVQLVTCDMKNDDQSAQKCGQQFANDPTIPFAILLATLNGGPFYAAMEAANKPVLGAFGATNADESPTGVHFYYAGSSYSQTEAQYVLSLKPKSVALIYESNGSTNRGQAIISSALTAANVSVKATAIPPAAADVTAQVASAGIASADVTIFQTNGTCPQIIKAMQSLGIKPKQVVIAATCATPAQIAAAPTDYEGWGYFNVFKLAASGSAGGPDVTTFLKGWSDYGPGGTPGTWAEMGWGIVLTAAQVFKTVAAITSASAEAAIEAYHGAVVMGASAVSCPGPAPDTATCVVGANVYKLTNGKLVASAS